MAKVKKSEKASGGGAKKSSKKGGAGSAKELATAQGQVEKLRGSVEQLERKLEKAKVKASRWKAEARQERSKVAKLEAKLRRATRDAPVDHAPPAERGDLPVEESPVPDESWTVVRLRAAAREKQVPGASRMTKGALLEVLRG